MILVKIFYLRFYDFKIRVYIVCSMSCQKSVFDNFDSYCIKILFLNVLGQCSLNQSFKTRTGLAGRLGTRPTRAWDRSRWRQKPAWELARRNPVDPGPGPPRWDPITFFLYILAVIKRRCFGLLKGQNAEDWRVKKNVAILGTIAANLINSTLWNPAEEQRTSWLLIVVVSLRKRFESPSFTLCFLYSWSFSELLAPIPSQPNCWHQFQSLTSIRCSLIHSQPSHLRFVSLGWFLNQFLSFLFCSSISTSAKKMKTLLFAVFNVNRWWTLECCYRDSVCVWFDAYYHDSFDAVTVLPWFGSYKLAVWWCLYCVELNC